MLNQKSILKYEVCGKKYDLDLLGKKVLSFTLKTGASICSNSCLETFSKSRSVF